MFSLPKLNLSQQQTQNIVFITFWSQFGVYVLNTILILFLTRPLIRHGLGYDQARAYAFMGISYAMGYLMPILGGFMADKVIGIRRSILIGSLLVAMAYLLVMLSGYTLNTLGDRLFLAAFALLPASNSILMGTTSSLISHIYSSDDIKAKAAMTYYYLAINLGALLATIIAPSILESRYGPLSIFAITFVGKSIAALNFARRYSIYDSIVFEKDTAPFTKRNIMQLVLYFAVTYGLTLYAYLHVHLASIIITVGCVLGILGFVKSTIALQGEARTRQAVALLLILEAVVFFIIYNQMGTTLILFAKNNSDLNFLGLHLSPAHYQMLNPILILLIGSVIPRFYRLVPRFTIPYQFATGTVIAGFALLLMVFAAQRASQGLVNGNYIGLTYMLISIAELLVSAIGLSMIGLYCDEKNLAFAMGVWYLASSMSYAISGQIATKVAIPESVTSPIESLAYYKSYYSYLGLITIGLGCSMCILAIFLQKRMAKAGIDLA